MEIPKGRVAVDEDLKGLLRAEKFRKTPRVSIFERPVFGTGRDTSFRLIKDEKPPKMFPEIEVPQETPFLVKTGEEILSMWGRKAWSREAHLLELAVHKVLDLEGEPIGRFSPISAGLVIHQVLPMEKLLQGLGRKYGLAPMTVWKAALAFVSWTHETELKRWREAGVSHVTLYRGVYGELAEKLLNGESIPVRNFESWTPKVSQAEWFSERGPGGLVIRAQIPVERILFSYKSTQICNIPEYEVLILNPSGTFSLDEFEKPSDENEANALRLFDLTIFSEDQKKSEDDPFVLQDPVGMATWILEGGGFDDPMNLGWEVDEIAKGLKAVLAPTGSFIMTPESVLSDLEDLMKKNEAAKDLGPDVLFVVSKKSITQDHLDAAKDFLEKGFADDEQWGLNGLAQALYLEEKGISPSFVFGVSPTCGKQADFQSSLKEAKADQSLLEVAAKLAALQVFSDNYPEGKDLATKVIAAVNIGILPEEVGVPVEDFDFDPESNWTNLETLSKMAYEEATWKESLSEFYEVEDFKNVAQTILHSPPSVINEFFFTISSTEIVKRSQELSKNREIALAILETLSVHIPPEYLRDMMRIPESVHDETIETFSQSLILELHKIDPKILGLPRTEWGPYAKAKEILSWKVDFTPEIKAAAEELSEKLPVPMEEIILHVALVDIGILPESVGLENLPGVPGLDDPIPEPPEEPDWEPPEFDEGFGFDEDLDFDDDDPFEVDF